MRVAGVCVALAAAFAIALVAGKASGGDDGGGDVTEVKVVKASEGSMKAPKLAGTGSIPDLHEPPAPASSPAASTPASSGSGTSSGTTSSSPTTSAPTVPSTGGGGGGGSGPVAPPPG